MSPIQRLLEIMQKLRDPDEGCPWDIQQSFASIAPYTLEEAYEVVDAIEREDFVELKGELGDLLLQVVFHSQIAHEAGLFAFADVCHDISDKMERRHPHVFGHASPQSAAQVRANWQQIKQQERDEDASILSGIPSALPALKKAQKLGSRASSIGFDWPSSDGAMDKVTEEFDELKDAIRKNDKLAVEGELGDMLFSIVNVCRHFGVDAETALNRTNRKFTQRFQFVEERQKAHRQLGADVTLEALDGWWNEAKKSN